MKTQSNTQWAEKGNGISLHEVVDELIIRTSLQAARNGNIILNEVEADIQILAHPGKVKRLLNRILEIIITLTKKTHTNISAKIYSDLVLVHFKEDNIQNTSPVLNELKQIFPEAEHLGGFLGITSDNYKFTTISFTFPNARNAQIHLA